MGTGHKLRYMYMIGHHGKPSRRQDKSPRRDHPPRHSRVDQPAQDHSRRRSKEHEGRTHMTGITTLVNRDVRLLSCFVGSTTLLHQRAYPRLAFTGSSVVRTTPGRRRDARGPRVARVGLIPGLGLLPVFQAVGAARVQQGQSGLL